MNNTKYILESKRFIIQLFVQEMIDYLNSKVLYIDKDFEFCKNSYIFKAPNQLIKNPLSYYWHDNNSN